MKDRGTNVFKLFEAVDLNGHRTRPELDVQVALYDDGVGTQGFLPLKLLGGAFGLGLKRNVLSLYTGLVRIYDPGDRIYLFGFSRGAFTVRTLAGLITRCGVLDWKSLNSTDEMRKAVRKAYKEYRKAYCPPFWSWFCKYVRRDAEEPQKDVPEKINTHAAAIRFIGVWDTVDAVGGPFHISDFINVFVRRFKFPDLEISASVEYAVHALSIDDERAAFEPRLWKQSPKVEQVWFAGVHSNVGGGYPKQGMSLVTLDWMIQKAATQGLRILPDESRWYAEHGSVNDKLYDARAGLGVFYRWQPRNIQSLYKDYDAGGVPLVHLSVLERIALGTDGYSPTTLPSKIQVVYTPTGDDQRDAAAAIRAEAAMHAANIALAHIEERQAKVRHTLIAGRISYYLYLASCLATLFGLFLLLKTGSPIAASMILSGIAAIVLSATLSSAVERSRRLEFSRFWHTLRWDLREALKSAREQQRLRVAAASARAAK